MAERLKGKGGSRSKKKANGAETGTAATHNNFKVDRKEAKAYFDRLDRVHAEMEEENGRFRADIKDIYAEAGDKLGIRKTIVSEIYREHRYEMKKQARENARDGLDADQADKLRLALGSYAGSPLGKAAIERAERVEAAKEIAAAAGD